jgi:hypothetical protein
VGLEKYRGTACAMLAASLVTACSNPPPPPPARNASIPREPQIDSPTRLEATTPYRAKLAQKGAELYLPPWFSPTHGGYDLIVHFHGLGRLQEANIAHAELDVAVVSVNLGVGTDAYGAAFRDPAAFQKLLAETQDEIDKSGRGRGAHLRRLALSAWSAGFVSVARIMSDPQMAERVDAVLLADGIFTSFTDLKHRTMNTEPLEKFVRLAAAATQGNKLFAITHTTIPTADYPSTLEVVGKLLEMTGNEKAPPRAAAPDGMHEIYEVDRGSFHVKGFEGVTARDHIQQIHAMGETIYPYLRARWSGDGSGNAEANVGKEKAAAR